MELHTANVSIDRPGVTISVILCAYTEARWDDLAAAITSVVHQSLPPKEIVVVIDHNAALLARCREQFPFALVVENTEPPGLSGARNSGIRAASGDLIAFLDDDAAAETDWLHQLYTALENPDVMGAGGSIIPRWEGEKPAWFPEEFAWVVGCTHRGTPLGEVRNLVGANMLIRRSVFDTVGGFRSEIGRIGTLPLGCEETEFCIRVRQNWPNARFMHVPTVKVLHHVPEKRARWAYFRSRCYAEGLSKAVVSQMVGAQDGLSAERAYTLRALPQGVLRGLADTVTHGDLSGLARAGAIIAGLAITTAGYTRGVIANQRTAPEKEPHPLPLSAAQRGESRVSVPPRSEGERGRAGEATDGGEVNRNKPLNILMVSARFPPYIGGTEMHTYEVSRRMASWGHHVTVLTTDPGGNLPAIEHKEDTPNMIVRRVRAYPAHRDYYFAPGLFSVIRGGDWDIVHIQGYHTLVAPMAMLAAILARKPFTLTFHSGGHSSAARNAARSFQRLLLRPLLARAAVLIGVSRFEAKLFSDSLHLPWARFRIVTNGSNLPRNNVPSHPSVPNPLVVSPGRLEPYKGHHRVIEAMPKVLEKCPDVQLRIVGTGPYEEGLRALSTGLGVDQHVEIGGIPASDRAGMAALLMQASLVVLLSEYEANPVAVLEALSLQRPVLVTETSGLGELAQQGYAASIPLGSSPDQIADAILQQIEHPLTPTRINLPTWDDCAAQLLAIYQQVQSRN